jgi:hypothetical protein
VTEPKTTFSGGKDVVGDHKEIDPMTGQQKAYVVLSEEERLKGFVRSVRRKYVHTGVKQSGSYDPDNMEHRTAVEKGPPPCGQVTIMAQDIAETFARDPGFYSGTYCAGCKTHLPLFEFTWEGTTEVMGT